MTPTFISTLGVWGSLFISLNTPKIKRTIAPMIAMWNWITLNHSHFVLRLGFRALRLGIC